MKHAEPGDGNALGPFPGNVDALQSDLTSILHTVVTDLTLSATWPTGAPAGVLLVFQEWIVDPAGPLGLAASNGLQAVAP